MAEIAAIFHWPLADLLTMDLPDLIMWRNLAAKIWNRQNAPPKKTGKGSK